MDGLYGEFRALDQSGSREDPAHPIGDRKIFECELKTDAKNLSQACGHELRSTSVCAQPALTYPIGDQV
jgi:hypothetical protein